MKGINSQIKKIQQFAKDIEKKEELIQYEKYKSIFDEAISYIKNKKVLLYGGMAINDLLPKKDKIYETNVLPDIDIFSTNGKKQANNIVKYFVKKGYSKITTNYTEALHENTFKVYVDSVQVFDITTISKKAYKNLSINSVRGDSGINIVNPQFLRLSLHMIMSQLYDASKRWEKVYKRLVIFYKHYPPVICKSNKQDTNVATIDTAKTKSSESIMRQSMLNSSIPIDLVDNIYKFLENKDYILFGTNELLTYIENYSKSDIYLPSNLKIAPIQVIATGNILDIAHTIVNSLNIDSISISKIFESDEFIPEHVMIKYKNHQLIEIYNIDVCLTYVNYGKYRIASINTIIRMYLSMLLSTYDHFKTNNDYLECVVNMLSAIQQDMSKSRKRIFQQILKNCYGPYYGLVTLRRNRLLRLDK